MGVNILNEKDLIRFRKWFPVQDTNDCWEPKSWTTRPSFYVDGIVISTARISWAIANNRWPRGFVLHTCDNDLCYNPAHLYEGTPQDNVNDMVNRNIRASPSIAMIGNRNAMRLSTKEVKRVKRLREKGYTIAQIATTTNIIYGTVYSIITGRTYRDIL